MYRKDGERTSLGVVKIKDDAISSIALIAAGEIEGVKSIGCDSRGIAKFLMNKDKSCIKVNIDKDQEVEIKIPLVVKYGFNIPDVAIKVQENVRNALEKMTNLSLKDIDIVVQEIDKD